MAEETKKTTNSSPKDSDKIVANVVAKSVYGEKKKKMRDRRDSNRRDKGIQDEFEQRIVDIARVTRVMAGGKRMRFRACVALGNKKGKIGIGLAKGADVTLAVTKAVNVAKKNMVNVPITNETIPHEINQKFGAAQIVFKPAKKGRGVIAGGVVRIIMELAGVKNVTCKTLGTNNKVNNAKCVITALANLKNDKRGKETEKSENSEQANNEISKSESK